MCKNPLVIYCTLLYEFVDVLYICYFVLKQSFIISHYILILLLNINHSYNWQRIHNNNGTQLTL